MSGTRRKPWLLRMPIPDPHTGITVMKTVGTYVTREEAEAVRAEKMKRPATPYQDSVSLLHIKNHVGTRKKPLTFSGKRLYIWWRIRDSNPRPPACDAGALTS